MSNGGAVATETTETKDEAPAEVASDEAKPATDEAAKVEEKVEEAKSEEEGTKVEVTTDEPPTPEATEATLSEEEAATKIQAVIRGKKARIEVKALKESGDADKPVESEEPAVAESTEPAAPVVEEEFDEKEQEAAAVKIQASFRGMKARKEVEAMKDTKQEGEEDTAVESADPEKSDDN